MTMPSGKRCSFLVPRFSDFRATSDESGFTILELSIVLAIISLVTVMAVTSGIAVIATARQAATVQKMAAIDKAMMAFRVANDRIPCPSDLTIPPGTANYGVEAGTPSFSTNVANQVASDYQGVLWSTCVNGPAGTPQANLYSTYGAQNPVVSAVEGGVPTVALGLPNDFMYDGWGNRIRYAVDANMTVMGSFSAMPAGALCSPITVCDSAGVSGGACVNTARSSYAMYALISHGADGYGAYTQSGVKSSSSSDNANEQINCHYSAGACTALVSGSPATFSPIYVQQLPGYQSSEAGNQLYYFDDIVTYKERWQMQTAWDRQGAVCPAIWGVDTAIQYGWFEFDMNGNMVNWWNGPGQGNGTNDGDIGNFGNSSQPLAIDSKGNIWLIDTENNRVEEESNSSGEWLMSIGGPNPTSGDSSNNCSGYATSATTAAALPGTTGYCGQDQSNCGCASGTSNGMFNFPQGIVLDSSNNIWVADTSNNRVQEFNSSGEWLLTIGPMSNGTGSTTTTPPPGSCSTSACPSGTGNGEFNNPTAVTIDPSGNIWVADTNNNRVQKFSNSGGWLLTIGGGASCSGCVSNSSCTCSSGSSNSQFTGPSGVAADANGNIWVIDGNGNAQEFNSSGTWLTTISGYNIYGSITIDTSGNIYAGANPGDQIGVFKFSNIGGVWTNMQTMNDTEFMSFYGPAFAR